MSKCKALNPLFLEKLAELLRSRVPLRQALAEIVEVQRSSHFQVVLERVENGEPLSEGFLLAMGGQGILARGLYRILQAGENHARIEDALIEASQWLTKFGQGQDPKPYRLSKSLIKLLKNPVLIVVLDPVATGAGISLSLMHSGITASEPGNLSDLIRQVRHSPVAILDSWVLDAELIQAMTQVLWMQSVILLIPAKKVEEVKQNVQARLGDGFSPHFVIRSRRNSG